MNIRNLATIIAKLSQEEQRSLVSWLSDDYTKETTSTMNVLCHMFNNAPITYVNKNLKVELKD